MKNIHFLLANEFGQYSVEVENEVFKALQVKKGSMEVSCMCI